ncbi:protein kibra-like [Arachis ipaensis]|uniref:protein kibra-like n=1 Tax=Arachis ipaensis TaxID=130454 RepID=UPI0007AF0870|nr:protein kibra-like [Arachis ipaensis]
MAKLSLALVFALTFTILGFPVRTVVGDDVSSNNVWLSMFNQASLSQAGGLYSSSSVSESTIDEAKKALADHESSADSSSSYLEGVRNSIAQAAAKKAAADALSGFGFSTPSPPSLPNFSDWVEQARNMEKGIFKTKAPVEAPAASPSTAPAASPSVSPAASPSSAPNTAPVASPQTAPVASPKLTPRNILFWWPSLKA